jgi:AraC-like DNA-binding protein
MVNMGQIEAVAYRNPVHPELDIEVFTLAELRRKLPERHSRERSRPDFHQLMLVTAGRTAHFLDFVRHQCLVGTVVHARPGQVQQFALSAGVQGHVVLFTPSFLLPEAATASPLMDDVVPSGRLQLAESQRRRVADAFEALVVEYASTDGGPTSRRILQHLLHALLLKLAAYSGHAQAPTPTGAVRTHRRFVIELERRYSRSRSVADYAEALGYSTKTLSRACRTVAGAGPKTLIERRVALEAKRLLAHTTLAVGAIAVEVGFSEPTNFVKFFRRVERCTPSAFRTAHTSALRAA